MLHRNCFVRYLRAHFCIRNRINERSKRVRSVKCQQLPYRYAHTFPEVFQINATLRNNVVLGGSVSSARRTCYPAVPGSLPIRLYKYYLLYRCVDFGGHFEFFGQLVRGPGNKNNLGSGYLRLSEYSRKIRSLARATPKMF